MCESGEEGNSASHLEILQPTNLHIFPAWNEPFDMQLTSHGQHGATVFLLNHWKEYFSPFPRPIPKKKSPACETALTT